MTTGGQGRDQDGEEVGVVPAHKQMAAALSHILSTKQEATLPKSLPVQRRERRREKRHKVAGGERKGGREKEEEGGRQKREWRRKRKREPNVEEEEEECDSDEDSERMSLQSEVDDVVRGCHRIPDVGSLDSERRLQRIATTGVVQLFNAVSQQQKAIEAELKEAGPSERKKAKVLSCIDKGSFIDLLKGRKSQLHPLPSTPHQPHSSQSPKWSILHDNYMLGAKLRDWGKEEEGEGEEGKEGEDKSFQDSDSEDSS